MRIPLEFFNHDEMKLFKIHGSNYLELSKKENKETDSKRPLPTAATNLESNMMSPISQSDRPSNVPPLLLPRNPDNEVNEIRAMGRLVAVGEDQISSSVVSSSEVESISSKQSEDLRKSYKIHAERQRNVAY